VIRWGKPRTLILADTGPLFALINAADPAHRQVTSLLQVTREPVRVPSVVVVELAYLLGSRIGAEAEASLLESIGSGDLQLEDPQREDYDRAATLVRQYADFPLGTVDALIVAMAERLEVRTLLTLDRRHFAAVRPRHCDGFRVVPT
jgi:predicted nucleic acid-binding protein